MKSVSVKAKVIIKHATIARPYPSYSWRKGVSRLINKSLINKEKKISSYLFARYAQHISSKSR